MNPFQIFLLILSGLVLSLILLLFLPVRLYFCYDGQAALRLKILCFSIPLYPKKKKWKMKDHLPEYQKKRKRKEKKTTSTQAKKEDDRPLGEKISELFYFVTRLLDRIVFPSLGRLKHHLTVRISRFEIVIGSEDAAKSALLYASAVNAGYALLAFLDRYTKLRKGKHARIAVSCPYTESKSSALCEFEIGIHLFGALFTLLPALYTYLTEFSEKEPPSHKV